MKKFMIVGFIFLLLSLILCSGCNDNDISYQNIYTYDDIQMIEKNTKGYYNIKYTMDTNTTGVHNNFGKNKNEHIVFTNENSKYVIEETHGETLNSVRINYYLYLPEY